jgi:vaccinia related kinase
VQLFIGFNKLIHLGVPRFIASGLVSHQHKQYRFLVIPKYSQDLQSVLTKTQHMLPEDVVLYITRQILYSLEYIHSKGYSHGDIKGSNLVFQNNKQVYLIDYGLSNRFSRNGLHNKYIRKKELRHNGTPAYASRDSHDGVCKLMMFNT